MTKKVCIALIVLLVLVFGNIFVVPHTLKPKLVDEIKCTQKSGNLKYFFIKDEKYNGFYDGYKRLNWLVPEYDLSELNTDKYTYLVCVNREVKSVSYSGLKCKKRTVLFFPKEYQAEIECGKETTDDIVRLYRIKKINIDYDYHSE